MQLHFVLFLFFCVLGNQPENGLPTQKSYLLFFQSEIALLESSGHLFDNRYKAVCVPGSQKKWRISHSSTGH